MKNCTCFGPDKNKPCECDKPNEANPGAVPGYTADLEKAIDKSLLELEKMSGDDIKKLVEAVSNDERALALYYLWNPTAV